MILLIISFVVPEYENKIILLIFLLFLYKTSLGYNGYVLHPNSKLIILEAKNALAYDPPVPINKQLSFSLKFMLLIFSLADEFVAFIIRVFKLLIFILQRLIFFFQYN